MPDDYFVSVMRISLSLLLYILATTPFSAASLFSSESVLRTAHSVRHRAIRRGVDFARDLQLAYEGIFSSNQEPLDRQAKLYCVNNVPPSAGLGGSVNPSTAPTLKPSGSQTVLAPAASGSVGSSPSPSGASSTSSPWTLVQSYVSLSSHGREGSV